jgi:membrane associated rhomboid family serine protease
MIPIGDARRRFGFPWMTILLLGISLAIFLFERQGSDPLPRSVLALVPRDVVSANGLYLLQKALSAALVQGPGWFEPIVNMVYLWVLGNKVEDACGPWGLLWIGALGAVGGVALKLILHPYAGEPVYGLAGVVAALFGAYLVVYAFRAIPSWLPPMVATLTPVPAVLHLLYWGGLVFVNVDFALLRSGKVLQAFAFEPTWPYAGALVVGLLAGPVLARREYLYYRLLAARAARTRR